MACSQAFESATGQATGKLPAWFSAGANKARVVRLPSGPHLVWSGRCDHYVLVGLVEVAEFARLEDALWDYQLRLSTVYSELAVKNKRLADTLASLRTRETELEQLNRSLEAKVAEHVEELKRASRLKRYLSPEIVSSIVSNDAVNWQTHKRLVTIFFVELADFDELTGEMESEGVTALVFGHGGTIDKSIGSRIIGFFGDPIPVSDHALRAVRMAIAMREMVRTRREHWFLGPSVAELRAGIHTGYATVGNVGSAERMDYTAVGKNVTLAAQLQQEAQPGQILLSARTYELVKDQFDCARVQVTVKWGSKPISVFNLRARAANGAGNRWESQTLRIDEPGAAGERLGHYKIVCKLGEGGMGVVFKGYDEALDRTVALKLLSPALSQDENFLARFKREARSLASVNSPHIVQIYFVSEHPPFFAMEFVDGATLGSVIQKTGRIPLRQALDVTCQVVAALDAAWDKGIIHRDIKPDNIMLTGKGVVKVTDFGLVKTTRADPGQMAASQGLVLGTPFYMAPEQARGEEIDLRADMYSLGATMFHMLIGQPPFRGESALARPQERETARGRSDRLRSAGRFRYRAAKPRAEAYQES